MNDPGVQTTLTLRAFCSIIITGETTITVSAPYAINDWLAGGIGSPVGSFRVDGGLIITNANTQSHQFRTQAQSGIEINGEVEYNSSQPALFSVQGGVGNFDITSGATFSTTTGSSFDIANAGSGNMNIDGLIQVTSDSALSISANTGNINLTGVIHQTAAGGNLGIVQLLTNGSININPSSPISPSINIAAARPLIVSATGAVNVLGQVLNLSTGAINLSSSTAIAVGDGTQQGEAAVGSFNGSVTLTLNSSTGSVQIMGGEKPPVLVLK